MGIGDVPNEILIQICECFCSHCLGLPLRPTLSRHDRVRLESLIAFSRTSKRHYEIATGVLYHRPCNLDNKMLSFEKCNWFPGFGTHVKEMIAMLAGDAVDHLAVFLQGAIWQKRNRGSDLYHFTPRDQFIVNTMRSWLSLRMIPNLEVLCLTVGLQPLGSFNVHDYPLVCFHQPRFATKVLQKLRSLRIEGKAEVTDLCEYFFLFTRVFCNLPALTDLTFVGRLRLGSTIHQDFCHAFSSHFCAELRSLRFFRTDNQWGTNNTNGLISLLSKNAPHLKIFVYRLARDYLYYRNRVTLETFPSPYKLVRSLCRHQRFLRHLDLDMGMCGVLGLTRLPLQCRITDLQIQSLEHLRILKLEEHACCGHWWDDDDTEMDGDLDENENYCFSRLIRPRLHELTIRLAPDSRAVEDVAYLADALLQGRFPRLHTVQIVPPRWEPSWVRELYTHIRNGILRYRQSIFGHPDEYSFAGADVYDGTNVCDGIRLCHGMIYYPEPTDNAESFEFLPKDYDGAHDEGYDEGTDDKTDDETGEESDEESDGESDDETDEGYDEGTDEESDEESDGENDGA